MVAEQSLVKTSLRQDLFIKEGKASPQTLILPGLSLDEEKRRGDENQNLFKVK